MRVSNPHFVLKSASICHIGCGGGSQIENMLNKNSITKGDGKYNLNLQAFFLYSMGINANIEKMENELQRHGPNNIGI